MANENKSLTLRIKGDTENARREFAALLKDLKGVDSGVLGVGKNFKAFGAILGGLGIGAILGTMAAGLGAVTREAAQAERIEGKLNAVIKATGGAANLSAEELGRMADELARVTEFDDDSLKEAMTVLLAFPRVGRQVFGDAIALATDLSVVMGGDLNGAARAVGRALQDPVGGLRLLKTELGINTAALGEQNEALLQSGDLLGAQKNVIAELQGRLGGAAAGANTGLYGSTKDVSKAWNDLLETIGRTPEISAGATRSLTSLVGVLRLINEELQERNENFLRDLGVAPPRRLTAPKEVGRLDGAGLPSVRIKSEAEQEAEKKATEEFRKALADLQKRIALLGKEKVEEQILFEVQQGRYKNLAQGEKDALVAAAQRFDAAKSLQDFEKEALDDLSKQIKAEEDYNEAQEKSAEAVRNTIEPARELFKEMANLDTLYREGRLSIDEYLDATLEVQGRLAELGKDTKKTTDEMTEFAKEAARGMQGAFAEEFFNILDGQIDNLGESFVRLLKRMAAELAASEVMKFLTGDFGKTGEVGGALGALFAGFAHSGGVVGSGLPGRRVPALAFAGAERFHDGGTVGLRDDEVPIIARRGETVLTPEQMRGGFGGDVKVMVENRDTPIRATDTKVNFDAQGMVIKVITEDLHRGGAVSNALAGTFGLRRR